MASGDESLEIGIEGGAPFGFRLFGGDGQPLVIAKLRRKSKAWDAGLEEGDVLLSINENPCRNISHAEAMKLVDSAGYYLNLNVLRKGGVTSQLHVTRLGGSRQRSLTPSTMPPSSGQFQTTRSPEPPRSVSNQSVQWSSRTTASVHQPTFNSPPQQQRTFQIHLSEPETGPDDDDHAWNRPSKSPGFQLSKEHSRSPSNGPLLFSVAPPPSPQQQRPSGAPQQHPRPSGTQNKSPAAWKPPSWQPESPEPTRTSSFSQETSVTRFSASTKSNFTDNARAVWKPTSWQTEPSRTTYFPQEETHAATPRFSSNASKENVPPSVNRATPSFQNNQVEVAKHKPNVWQPSASPMQPRKVFPAPSLSPGPEFDLRDGGVGGGGKGGGWKPPTMRKQDASPADGFGKPPFHEMPPHLNKILSANVDNDDDFGSILHDTDKKQVYVDSSFYHDPAHKYPTVDEQIKMARQVALSLTAPSNVKARGHRMFMKRKEKSDKWVVDTSQLELTNRGGMMSDTEADLYYNPNPTPWNAAASSWRAEGGGAAFPRDVPAPPPLSTSKLFAPKLIPEDQSKALSAEEFERLRLFSQKTTHNMINPQICFTLAEDLRQSKGKGGRMFAKRRAKSDEWTIEGGPAAPDPKLLQKISGGFAPAPEKPTAEAAPVNNGTRSGVVGELPPVNRLKEMIELPKAKMTPWDAMVDYGNVELAFEHLEGISFMRPKTGVSPFADSVASSLQQATQRKSEFTSRPTSAARGQPVQPPSHPSPAWNQPKEMTTNNRLGNKMAPNSPGGFVDFSPSSYGSGSGSVYRPVAFQSSAENRSFPGRFSDL